MVVGCCTLLAKVVDRVNAVDARPDSDKPSEAVTVISDVSGKVTLDV